MLLVLLAASGFGAWAIDHWQPSTAPDSGIARRALLQAESTLRRLSPDRAAQLGRLSEAARASDAPDRWDPAVAFAVRSLQESIRERRRLEERWQAGEQQLQQHLERIRKLAQASVPSRHQAEQLWIAEAAQKRALRHAARGELQPALEAAAEAREATERVEEAWRSLHERFGQHDSLRQWSAWVAQTVAESRSTGKVALVMEKLPRRMTVYSAGHPVRTFRVELGVEGLRRKLFAGDRATPEGRYRVTAIKVGGATRFHKALLLDYPNEVDRERYRVASRDGRIPQGRDIGSLIEIHGHGGRGTDWTDGCVALTDGDMDWLVERVEVGTPVTFVGSLPSE